jgi:hypothetical protein
VSRPSQGGPAWRSKNRAFGLQNGCRHRFPKDDADGDDVLSPEELRSLSSLRSPPAGIASPGGGRSFSSNTSAPAHMPPVGVAITAAARRPRRERR